MSHLKWILIIHEGGIYFINRITEGYFPERVESLNLLRNKRPMICNCFRVIHIKIKKISTLKSRGLSNETTVLLLFHFHIFRVTKTLHYNPLIKIQFLQNK